MRDGVVVITGASAGLARATAREFGRHGAKVGLIARGIEGLEAAKREIESAGDGAMMLPLDVAAAKAIEDAAAAIEDELGPIDIWVNNAMASVFSPVNEMKADEYKRVTDVTYLGWLNRYLGNTGFDSRQTPKPENPERPDNLWKAVNGDHGPHGRFDRRAHESNGELKAGFGRGWIGAGLVVLAASLSLASRCW